MTARVLLDRQLQDILLYLEMDKEGMDYASIQLKIDDRIVDFPWSFLNDKLEQPMKEGAVSLFKDLSDEIIYHVNPERKKMGEVLEAKERRAKSLKGRIRKLFGIVEGIPLEYRPYKFERHANPLKDLQNQVIKDVLYFEDSEYPTFLELENGKIISEIIAAPHGTGRAGLNLFQNVKEMEERMGSNYQRLSTSTI